EFARRLAERGADLVLVARRQGRLEALAAELRAAHGVTAVPIALDLTAPAAGERLRAAVAERGLTVTSVINNAGFGTEGPFAEEDPERLRA
ncbi:SDR family NAD(P)-dependent oxidoreductase, partial [Streptomyces sp. MS2A]|nr:SDR family NAD(P)-dependent oxidoreductase [Streptomyces sp. MS2A]